MSAPGATDGMIYVPDPADRDDLRTLLRRVLRLDEAAVVRLTSVDEGRMRVWARTPFGALAVRVLRGDCPGGDVVCGADHLLTELDILPRGDAEGAIDPGMPLLSAWQGLLPPADGFHRVEDVPAQVLLDLPIRRVARESAGPAGLRRRYSTGGLVRAGLRPVGIDTDSVLIVMCGFVPERGGRARRCARAGGPGSP